VGGDLELAARQFLDLLREDVIHAEQVSSTLGKLDVRRQRMLAWRMHDGRCDAGGQHAGQACTRYEGTTFHVISPVDDGGKGGARF
jgi:hypothetical protein